jgi:DNA-binding XRE family transcriptional regulator
MVNVTDIVLDEESKELNEILASNPKAKAAYDQFEAECKLRRELANARKQQKISQTELQERTGLTQQVISRIERDNDVSPSLRNLIKYVNAIGYEITLKPKQ